MGQPHPQARTRRKPGRDRPAPFHLPQEGHGKGSGSPSGNDLRAALLAREASRAALGFIALTPMISGMPAPVRPKAVRL